MTDKKFSDEEIIKALECCLKAENATHCYKFGCPARLENGLCFYESNYFSEEECLKQMLEDALSLINRQKAEIEQLITLNSQLEAKVFDTRKEADILKSTITHKEEEAYNKGYEGYKGAQDEEK